MLTQAGVVRPWPEGTGCPVGLTRRATLVRCGPRPPLGIEVSQGEIACGWRGSCDACEPGRARGNDIDGASMLLKRHGWSIDVFHAAPRTRASALAVPE